MIVHPGLRALRRDDSPQRAAQEALYAALGAWRAQPGVAGLREAMEGFAKGVPIAECPALAALFDPGGDAAARLAGDFVRQTAAALQDAPLGHVPLRHYTDGISSTLLLARAGNVTLSLVAIDGEGVAGRQEPASVSFGPNETWEHVLAGSATAELVECFPTGPRAASLKRRTVPLAPGTLLYRDGTREARLLRSIDSCLVSLRLQRRHTDAGPSREYDLASGEMIHQAAGNPRDSRLELMIALLGRMERGDAAPAMAELACETGSTALRWQALRECLALDTQEGFRALCIVARAAGDPLAGPAGALRAQLVETYPQLETLEPCPM